MVGYFHPPPYSAVKKEISTKLGDSHPREDGPGKTWLTSPPIYDNPYMTLLFNLIGFSVMLFMAIAYGHKQQLMENPDVALLISWIGWRFALALYPAFFIIVVVGVVALSRRLLAVATAMVYIAHCGLVTFAFTILMNIILGEFQSLLLGCGFLFHTLMILLCVFYFGMLLLRVIEEIEEEEKKKDGMGIIA
ncbi:hypothetical protein PRIPAC_70791 [Pristionchus pacificus]|uniref:Uncharacterized protein n=1 Tax=Pristionchus pacificus TaxID=54126 RepID=A0A2A6BF20_PRIPA|nr:hypothetical protein PRIPAC_70791 [Pristionchus pacificus]|eukprot:PDM64456.1 hypothetical protein PRIPAC_52712 [Pristionchus pacificus]